MFGTSNFFATVDVSTSNSLTEFVRLVDVVLLFADGTKLLLSEYEADQVLQLVWEWSLDKKNEFKFRFMNLSYAVDAIEEAQVNAGFDRASQFSSLQLASVARMLLYNGETRFTRQQEVLFATEISKMLQNVQNRELTIREFVGSRGNSLRWPRSFLLKICTELDQEAAMAS